MGIFTEEHKEKIREAAKRRWTEGNLKVPEKCPICGVFLSKNHNCKDTKEKQRQAKLENPTRYWLGKTRDPETIRKLREGFNRVPQKYGSNNPLWTGGSSRWWHERAREAMESYLGRKLKKGELIHHINENWKDNRIENLKVVSRREHIKIHKPKR